MKILFYCQYVYGMGHFFRILELARGLSDHQVILVAGGKPVDVDIPDHVQLVRLPALYMDEQYTSLYAGEAGQSVAQIQEDRKAILFALFEQHRPDLFVVELYPFGRSFFEYELQPLLQAIRDRRFGPIDCVCSLRDVLVEKRDPAEYEQRVLYRLNRFFDLLLIHSDPQVLSLDDTFQRTGDIEIPVHYTGFVARHPQRIAAEDRDLVSKSDDGIKQIIASAGGGRSGFPLLAATIDACRILRKKRPIHLAVFAGPFMEEAQYLKLANQIPDEFSLQRFSQQFVEHLSTADLSISMFGYNTCMNLLAARTPALVYPYSRQQEQPLRAAKVCRFTPMQILQSDDLRPSVLSRRIESMLQQPPDFKPDAVNLDGVINTARILAEWHHRSR